MTGVKYSISQRNGGNYLLLEEQDLWNRSYGVVLYKRHDTLIVGSSGIRSESSIPSVFRNSKSRLYELTNDEIDLLVSQVRVMMSRGSPALNVSKIRELRDLEKNLLRSGELRIPNPENDAALNIAAIVASTAGGE